MPSAHVTEQVLEFTVNGVVVRVTIDVSSIGRGLPVQIFTSGERPLICPRPEASTAKHELE